MRRTTIRIALLGVVAFVSTFGLSITSAHDTPRSAAPVPHDIEHRSPQSVGQRLFNYVVMEENTTGVIRPVYEREVLLSEPRASLDDAARAQRLRETPRGSRAYEIQLKDRGGRTVFGDVVESQDWLRGEFDAGGGIIERHLVSPSTWHFVVRIPAGLGSTLTVQRGGAAATSIPLTDIVGAPLPLNAQVPPSLPAPAPSPANRVDLLLMGDGYRTDQQALFASDTSNLVGTFFDISPYADYANFVTVSTLFTPSVQAGADHPPYVPGCVQGDPSCCGDPEMQSDPLAGTFRNTAFNAAYCTLNIHRLLTVDHGLVLAAASAVPDWDRIMVLVNDSTYGGSGGYISAFSTNSYVVSVAQHEHGHSFTNLADEYEDPYPGYPDCSDISGPPCEANVTDQTVRALIKWAPWIDPSTPIVTPEGQAQYQNAVGLFQGARYKTSGMYRPGDACLMRVLNAPFCQVASQAYVWKLYEGGWGTPSDGIDLIEPASESPPPGFVPLQSSIAFSFDTLQPVGGPPLAITWYLDGTPQQQGSSSFLLTPTSQSHVVEARVRDTTPLVHPALADDRLVSTRTWFVGTSAVPNDNIADAQKLFPPISFQQSTALATLEPGEPLPCGMNAATVWFRFTAPESGYFTINTFGSDFDTVLALYSASISPSPSGLLGGLIECNDQAGGDQSQVGTFLEGGQTYYVQAGGWGGQSGHLVLNISGADACSVPNDDLVSASQLQDYQELCNVGATLEPGETQHCGLNATAWYRYDAPADGVLDLSAYASNTDPALAIYEAAISPPGILNFLACNTDVAPGYTDAAVAVGVKAGRTYYVQAGSENDPGTMSISSYLDSPCDISNDAISNAHSLLPGQTAYRCNIDATEQPVEPSSCGVGSTLWFTVQANLDGPMTVSTAQAIVYGSFDTVLAVYDGPPPPSGAGTLIACNDDAPGAAPQSQLTFNATAGHLYYVQVGGVGGTQGRFALSASCQADADCDAVLINDNCAAYNPGQANSDNGPWSNPGAPNDVTVPNGDVGNIPFGDGPACDWDSDNDHLLDMEEPQIPSPPGWPRPCPLTIASLDPLNPDSDGDRVLDGAECRMGSNPLDPTSKPVLPPATDEFDLDRDRLPNDFEALIGSDPTLRDTDADGITDAIEFKGYGTSPIAPDSDYDQCPDDKEIASLDGNTTVNSIDLFIVAQYFGSTSRFVPDVNRDGNVSSGDLGLVASRYGSSPVTSCAPYP